MQVSFDPTIGWSLEPKLPYRGARNYINGADLYAASSAIVTAAAGTSQVVALDVRYPRFTRCNGTFRLVEGEPEISKWAASSVRIKVRTADNRNLTGWYEEANQLPTERSENSEKTVVAFTQITGNSAKYIGEPNPPAIEILVYLTKTLLLHYYPGGRGKWIFTAIRLGSLLPQSTLHDVEIVLDSVVGERAASSSILIGGAKFGDIYFGRAEE